jgi:5-methylcytosine-specific restriction enzyme subunit McrC
MQRVQHQPAWKQEPLPVIADGSWWSLTQAEAERLAQIGEQRPGFCEVGHRQVKLAQFCGVVGLGERVLETLPKTQDGASSAGDWLRGDVRTLHR